MFFNYNIEKNITRKLQNAIKLLILQYIILQITKVLVIYFVKLRLHTICLNLFKFGAKIKGCTDVLCEHAKILDII